MTCGTAGGGGDKAGRVTVLCAAGRDIVVGGERGAEGYKRRPRQGSVKHLSVDVGALLDTGLGLQLTGEV